MRMICEVLQGILFVLMIIGMIKPTLFKAKRVVIFFAWIVLSVLVVAVAPEKSAEEKAADEKQQAEYDAKEKVADSIRSVKSGCKVGVRYYLEQTLNDPDSYEDVGWSNPIKVEGGYSVTHKYRAKNAMGAKILTSNTFTLDDKFHVINIK